jgi:hypothetical protein
VGAVMVSVVVRARVSGAAVAALLMAAPTPPGCGRGHGWCWYVACHSEDLVPGSMAEYNPCF